MSTKRCLHIHEVRVAYMSWTSRGFRFICFVALCFCTNFATAKNLPRYGMFVYSNFCISAGSGDLNGNRITLRRLSDGDSLIYEYTDGSTHVVVADKLVLNAKSGTLRFEAHAEGDLNAIVSGRISGDGDTLTVRGLLFNEETTFELRRTVNFAAPVKICK